MIQTTLQLRYTPHVLRPVAGWFVACADPRDWLDEAIRCFDSKPGQPSVNQSEVRLMPIPRWRHGREVGGVVMIPASSNVDEVSPMQATARRLPYGLIGRRLYLPVEARLEPEVSLEELDALLSPEFTYVWHPTAGLIALEPADVLSLADLLRVSRPKPGKWNWARTGERLPSRLHRIAPLDPPELRVVLQMGQDDIGSESTKISKLPPTSDEPKPGIGNAAKRTGLNILAGGIRGLAFFTSRANVGHGKHRTGSGASGSDGPTWSGGKDGLARLAEWTQQRLDHFNQALRSEREKEIHRLMNLLESDPDRGLRYALPVGGDAHRGLAQPSAHLSRRDTDFHLYRLGGGRAADPWDLSWQEQQQLVARYRELANREMRLGRYRRAAYIFGELLADFAATASALEQGKHWRDASVLYRQRLHRPLDAARCLEQGGLWTEAVEAYVELEEHEKAGDIFNTLQQHDESREQYRFAVVKARARGDSLTAAKILEEKLKAVDEAIDELSAAWPHAAQAANCLEQLFKLFARLGRHDAATRNLQQLRKSDTPQSAQLRLLEVFASNAARYPDRSVQKLAADSTQVLASQILVNQPNVDSAQVLQSVRDLAPEDRLLGRDCARFSRQERLAVPKAAIQTCARRNSPTLLRSIRLPRLDSTWRAEAAISASDAVFIAGRTDDGVLVIYRITWNGGVERLSWPTRNSTAELVLAVNRGRVATLLVHPVGGPWMASLKSFPATEDYPFATKVGAAPGMTPGMIAAAVTKEGMNWLIEQRGGTMTSVLVHTDGRLIHSQALTEFEADLMSYFEKRMRVPTFADDRYYFGIENQLVIFDDANAADIVEFEQPIHSIAGSFPNTRKRVAVSLDQGGLVSWDNDWEDSLQRFGADLSTPLIVFNRGGLLLAAHDRVCQVYTTHARRLALKAEIALSAPAVAVVSANLPNQFGVVLDSGRTDLYQIPLGGVRK